MANPVALIATIIINYAASAGIFNGQTIGEISAQYPTLVTPAGYAFSIWGLIYVMLAGFVAYQGRRLFKSCDNDHFVLDIGWWFVVSCIANSLWVITWVYNMTGLSVLMMTLLLVSLIKIILNTNMERWDAPMPIILFVWWPFCLYAGWITVAIIANVAAWLTKVGWNGFGLSDPTWAVMMILIAGIINLLMVRNRNMREFALTGVWALIGIIVANWGTQQAVVITATITAAVLFLAASIHAYHNQDTAPRVKWQQMKAKGKRLFN